MRPIPVALSMLLSALALAVAACSGNVPRQYDGVEDASNGPGGRAGAFSAERAWADLQWLISVGPRAVGTEGSEKARAYLEEQLEGMGLDVQRRPSEIRFDTEGMEVLTLVNLETEIPGENSDEIVLAAPYDSAYRESFQYLGVNDGASGAAVLLEIARVLAADPLPYSIRLLFLDGEAPLGRGSPEDREARFLGSTAAASQMESEREFRGLRLLVLLNRVSDADLRIARDRFSQRTYRDIFWETAADLGHGDVFEPSDRFEAPPGGHRSFIDHGMRRVVAIVDPILGAADVPDAAEFSEDDTLDHSSMQSLEVVGEVVLASLERICARLNKIDRFSEVPVPEELPAPEATADEAAAGPDEAASNSDAEDAGPDQAPSGSDAEEVETDDGGAAGGTP